MKKIDVAPAVLEKFIIRLRLQTRNQRMGRIPSHKRG